MGLGLVCPRRVGEANDGHIPTIDRKLGPVPQREAIANDFDVPGVVDRVARTPEVAQTSTGPQATQFVWLPRAFCAPIVSTPVSQRLSGQPSLSLLRPKSPHDTAPHPIAWHGRR